MIDYIFADERLKEGWKPLGCFTLPKGLGFRVWGLGLGFIRVQSLEF